MARYYNLDKLSELIELKADTMLEGKETFLYVAKWLNLLPTADVVEVVRCKDCKYYDDFYHNRCTNSDLVDSDDCYAYVCLCGDDFCSCGEKKG